MRQLFATVVTLVAASHGVHARDIPLPKPKPAVLAPAPELQNLPSLPYPEADAGPSPCDLRLAELADFTPLPALVGPGECGATGVVQLDAVMLRDRSRVPITPPATLRCTMAEALAHFVRDDMAPAAASLGAPLTAVVSYDSYECRGRNRVAGAKVSEPGKGNAIDIRAVRLGNGKDIELTDPAVAREFRERVRAAACSRFNTVLGPGSDSHHETHVHLDLAERSSGYRMCQWDVREPDVAANVPLPPPRPRDDNQNKK